MQLGSQSWPNLENLQTDMRVRFSKYIIEDLMVSFLAKSRNFFITDIALFGYINKKQVLL